MVDKSFTKKLNKNLSRGQNKDTDASKDSKATKNPNKNTADNTNNLDKIFDFLKVAEKLKSTLRYNRTTTGRTESSAEHSWRLSLMIPIVADELKLDVDVNRSIKIAIVHDLAESIVGDIDAIEIVKGNITKEEKAKKELKAMKKIKDMLPAKLGDDIFNLWKEYEDNITREAKFVKALDKIETLTQLVEVGYETWDYPDFIVNYADKHVKEFPELLGMLKHLKVRIKKEFIKGKLEWKKEYDV